MGFALLGFGLAQDPSPLPSFQFPLIAMEMSIQCLLCHGVLEAHDLFGVTGSQLEKNFASS